MSGLLGIFDPSGIPQDLPRYLSALGRLSHRGPDGEGTYLRPQIFLGHRRLSLGPGPGELQPLVALEGRVAIAFDGRISNRRELAHELAAKGHRSERQSDASLVLDAYVEYGEGCFQKLEGTWALVLWDERTQQLLVSRDRLGVRPLYYYQNTQLIVASEIKGILALEDEARVLNPRRIRSYLPGGLIDDWSDTFFLRVQPVPPGVVLTIARGKFASSRFWTLTPSTDRALRPEAVLNLLRETIDRTTPVDVNVGVSLSGGISSVIAGLVTQNHAPQGRRLQAFSIIPPHTHNESLLIDATVRHTGLAHRYVPLDTMDYSQALGELLDAHDEPVQWVGNLYQFVLRKAMAQAGCKAVLVGYGADEIFGGYEFLAPPFLVSLMASGRVIDSLRFAAGARGFLGAHPLRILANGVRDFAKSRQHKVRKTMESAMGLRSRLGQDDGFKLVSDLLAPSFMSEEVQPPAAEFDLSGLRSGSYFFEALLRCFRAHIPLLVRIEDRNASAHSLELCAPFLDHRVVETALAFPFHQYMKEGVNKAILRKAAGGVLAPEVLAQRRKFNTPGNNSFMIYEVLQHEFMQMLESKSFSDTGIWSHNCKTLYLNDMAQRARAGVWLRVYMVQRWYERVVRGQR